MTPDRAAEPLNPDRAAEPLTPDRAAEPLTPDRAAEPLSPDRAAEPLNLLELADLLGRYRYVELLLFGALGRRAPSSSEPAVTIYLAGASMAHGWRARLAEERLPVSVGLPDADASTRSPSSELDAAVAMLAKADDGDLLDGLLGTLYPAMAATYARHAAATSPAADPPIARLLRRLIDDLDAVHREGLEVACLLPAPRLMLRSAVEELLDRAGGPFGPLRGADDGRTPVPSL